jgi:hypothetical protein
VQKTKDVEWKDRALAVASDERHFYKSHPLSHRGSTVALSLTHPRNFNLTSLHQQIISARTHPDDSHPLTPHTPFTGPHIPHRKYGRHVYDCRKAGRLAHRTFVHALPLGRSAKLFATPQYLASTSRKSNGKRKALPCGCDAIQWDKEMLMMHV